MTISPQRQYRPSRFIVLSMVATVLVTIAAAATVVADPLRIVAAEARVVLAPDATQATVTAGSGGAEIRVTDFLDESTARERFSGHLTGGEIKIARNAAVATLVTLGEEHFLVAWADLQVLRRTSSGWSVSV